MSYVDSWPGGQERAPRLLAVVAAGALLLGACSSAEAQTPPTDTTTTVVDAVDEPQIDPSDVSTDQQLQQLLQFQATSFAEMVEDIVGDDGPVPERTDDGYLRTTYMFETSGNKTIQVVISRDAASNEVKGFSFGHPNNESMTRITYSNEGDGLLLTVKRRGTTWRYGTTDQPATVQAEEAARILDEHMDGMRATLHTARLQE